MKYMLLAVLTTALCTSAFAQTETCSSGTEDMMNYFVMGYPNRLTSNMGPGNANPIFHSIVPELGASFATDGYFLWVKSPAGYPWDVKTFDTNYVYDRSTELNWTDPTSFKRFNSDLPISKRCVQAGKFGGSVRIASTNTDFTFYTNCLPTQTQNLGYVINSISAPIAVSTGGNLGVVTTRYFTYRYSCDSTYSNCAYKEVFSLGYGVGLYDWKYYKNLNGTFKKVQESIINKFTSGAATPYLPCSSMYE